MSRFGFADDDIRRLMRAVRGSGDAAPGETDDTAGDRDAEDFARATWSMLAEPGDGTAGLVVAALGAARALDALLDGDRPDAIAARVDPEGGSGRGAVEREIAAALERWRPRLRSGDLVHAVRAAESTRTRLLLPGDELWPDGVDDLGVHAPLALWVRGTDAALAGLRRSVALVGARAATGYGEHVATEAAAGLSDRGLAIVSGAAYGIDGMAHRSCLAGGGLTIAFLAGGVDRFYPAGHDDLLTRIAGVGAVVSELPCGSQPTKWRFLQRNRLIAATSQATIVLEAGWRSGSLNTAGHAAALGRPLGAVPGPITSVASAGCHRLIRDYGAICVTNVDEMLELLPSGRAEDDDGGVGRDGATVERTSDEVRVLDALSARSWRDPSEVARRSGMAIAAVLGPLAALELDGAVEGSEHGWRKRGGP
ncbi:MAG: DNA-processing protein DprA [Leifsonia sp.]